MQPTQLMCGVAKLGESPLSIKLLFIANRIHSLTTESGLVLRDLSDVRVALLECYHAQLRIEQEAPRLLLHTLQQPTECGECHHVHTSGSYCGEYLGELEFCQCQAKVLA